MCRLPCDELVFLGSRYIALIARESSQHPFGTPGQLCDGSSDDAQSPNIGKGVSDDGADAHNSPRTGHAAYERKESGIHFDGISFVEPTNQANRPRADGASAPPASGPVEREVSRIASHGCPQNPLTEIPPDQETNPED